MKSFRVVTKHGNMEFDTLADALTAYVETVSAFTIERAVRGAITGKMAWVTIEDYEREALLTQRAR